MDSLFQRDKIRIPTSVLNVMRAKGFCICALILGLITLAGHKYFLYNIFIKVQPSEMYSNQTTTRKLPSKDHQVVFNHTNPEVSKLMDQIYGDLKQELDRELKQAK